MHPFELTILGSSSATPTSNRNPSAQLLNIAERYFLIDCGEGAQMQLRKHRIKFQRIEHIFISHLHGDHYLGLLGLLQSMHLLGRQKALHIFTQKGLKEIIALQNHYGQTTLDYEIIWHELNPDKHEVIWEDEKVKIECFPLRHRIPCSGFLFREQPFPRVIDKDRLAELGIPFELIPQLRAGNDIELSGGKRIKNADATLDPKPSRSFAYCSDTIYDPGLTKIIKGVNLLYHEATFLTDMEKRAKETFHTTALQAAQIATSAQVGQLLIGHFSARYHTLEPHLEEARAEFINTELAEEGKKFLVPA